MVPAVVGGIGLLIGSFLNVVVHRVPLGRSVVSPPSACGECGAGIRPRDNVPVLSWLLLRGRCRDCGARISARYPLVELGTAIAFALVAWWVTTAFPAANASSIVGLGSALAAFLYLAAISVALTMIDLETHTLPNRIVLPAYAVAAALLIPAALLIGEPGRLVTAAIGAAALFGAYLLIVLAYPGGMGLGDVKLAGVLGMYLGWLGWGPLAVGAFAAFVLGGLFGAILMLVHRANRKTAIPYGPWMIAGAWVGVFAGDWLAAAYLRLFGLGE
nr:A24 family peptidase [Diaminobutyricimonas sp. LJ205]